MIRPNTPMYRHLRKMDRLRNPVDEPLVASLSNGSGDPVDKVNRLNFKQRLGERVSLALTDEDMESLVAACWDAERCECDGPACMQFFETGPDTYRSIIAWK